MIELIYEYIRQRELCTRSDFAGRFSAPVLLFRRVRAEEELGERTGTQTDSTAAKRVADFLFGQNLRLRSEAYDIRLLRLPESGSIRIGRTVENHVPLAHRLVSKRHATINCAGGLVTVTDEASKNGTFVDDCRLAAHTPEALAPGHTLRIGAVRMRVLTAEALYDALDDFTEKLPET